jgi:DNA-binding NarL/FixJ family response regulator
METAADGAGTRTSKLDATHQNGSLMATTVLIVDDHASFRRAVRLVLEYEGYEVIGEAADGEEALTAAAELAPELVLLDVHMPGIDGFEVAERLTSHENPPKVVLTSSRDGSDFDQRVRRSGARGFIPKAEISGVRLADLLR